MAAEAARGRRQPDGRRQDFFFNDNAPSISTDVVNTFKTCGKIYNFGKSSITYYIGFPIPTGSQKGGEARKKVT